MPSVAVLAIVVALTIGPLSPFDRSDGRLTHSQGAPQTAVQTSCPSLSELGAGPSTLIALSLPVDRVLPAIGQALREWSKISKPEGTSILRTDASLIVEREPVQAYGQQPVSGAVGRTCFYEWRTGNRDTRIAFRFSVRANPKQGTTLELGWLSQTKGAAQRTWRNNPVDPGPLRDALMDGIRKVDRVD
jgi:hypothetical protein